MAFISLVSVVLWKAWKACPFVVQKLQREKRISALCPKTMVGAEPAAVTPRRLEVELRYAINPLVDGKTPEQINRIRRVLTGDSTTGVSPAPRGQNGSEPDEADGDTATDDAAADTGEADDEFRTRSASLGTELSRLRTSNAPKYRNRSLCVRWQQTTAPDWRAGRNLGALSDLPARDLPARAALRAGRR